MTKELNLIKQNMRRIVFIGIASPKKYKEMNQHLEDLYTLENKIKKEHFEKLKEINEVKKIAIEKIEKEKKKHKLIKIAIAGYLLKWLMK